MFQTDKEVDLMIFYAYLVHLGKFYTPYLLYKTVYELPCILVEFVVAISITQ